MNKPNEAQVADALASIARAEGKPVIEATIGPAEVHAPAYPEYVTLLREDWWAMGERATNAELRAARLARDLEEARQQADNDKRLIRAALAQAEQNARAAHPWMIATGTLAGALVGCLVGLWGLA